MPEKSSWIIGGATECDLVVDEETVSSRHCRLRRDENGFTVEDLNSTNGTFVNGQRIAGERRVTADDCVTLGQTIAMPWPKPGGSRTISIGRAEDNDIVLDRPGVSVYHAGLTVEGQRITVEDFESTNGTAVGTPDNLVKRQRVSRDDTIYFGSTAMIVQSLISAAAESTRTTRATRAVATSPDAASPVSDRKRDNSRQWMLFAGIGFAGMVGAALLLLAGVLFIALWPRNDPDPIQTAEAAKANGSPASGSPPAEEPAAKPTEPPPAAPASESAVPPKEQDPRTWQQQVESALFTVVASRPDQTESYRVGTAWAVDSHTLATSGAVVWYLKHRANELELTEHFVFSPATEQVFAIAESSVHPQFEAAREVVRSARQQAEQLLRDVPADERADIEEQVRDELLQYRHQAFVAVERQTHADGGVLRVAEELATILPLAPPETGLRPKRRVFIYGLPFDKEDYYFDRAEPGDVQVLEGRIRRLAGLTPDEPANQRLLLECGEDHLVNDYRGSPVLTEQGQVIGLYSRPTPVLDADSAKPPATLDAVLIDRLREMLTAQE